MTDARRFDVFLSYSHEDANWVRTLTENLHNLGFEVFFDEWRIGAGDRLIHVLEDAILNAKHGVVVVSPASIASPWVQEEYAAMMTRTIEGKQQIVAAILGDVDLPPFLGNRIYVDFRSVHGPDYLAQVRRLATTLKGEAPTPPARTGILHVPPSDGVRPPGSLAWRLEINTDGVTLRPQDDGADSTVTWQPRPLQHGDFEALWELERARYRQIPPDTAQHRPVRDDVGDNALDNVGNSVGTSVSVLIHQRALEAGHRLTRAFLGGDVGVKVQELVSFARGQGSTLDLALEVEEKLAALPWETLRMPDSDALSGPPLVLDKSVRLYRRLGGLGPAPHDLIPGPLRILVAISSPEVNNARGDLLDMERELHRILDAVASPEILKSAYVRILRYGSVSAIRAALEKERFHVLHISCHAGPGRLLLEDDHGGENAVSAEEFCKDVLVPNRPVPLVVLAGCSTAVEGYSLGRQRSPEQRREEPEASLPGFARALLENGIPSAIAMMGPISDLYASRLAENVYHHLATSSVPEVIAALSTARIELEAWRTTELAAGDPELELAEWSTPTYCVRGPLLRLFDRAAPFERIEGGSTPALPGVIVREVDDFVGRRGEERRLLRILRDPNGPAGVLIHGLGGVGKSSLSANLLHRLHDDGWIVASVAGAVDIDAILQEIGERLTASAFLHGLEENHPVRQVAIAVRTQNLDWKERLSLLRQIIFMNQKLVLLIDNFEDRLRDQQIVDPSLAEFLAEWVETPGKSRLLFTSRFPFVLPQRLEGRLETMHLGPLSVAETRKMILRLPGIRNLEAAQIQEVYGRIGGHPRTLEYLDALLRDGKARFDDVRERLDKQLRDRGELKPDDWWKGREHDLDADLAEAITLAADDVLLGQLLERVRAVPLAERLLIGTATYRRPVEPAALAWHVSEVVDVKKDPKLAAEIAEYRRRVDVAREEEKQPTPENLGYAQVDWTELLSRVAESHRPPIAIPAEFSAALEALLELSLVSPVLTAEGSEPRFIVHRWTADELLRRAAPLGVQDAHQRATQYWRWRTTNPLHQASAFIDDLIEARHHLRLAGDNTAAVEVTEWICSQLHTWGAWQREETLCRETLDWLPGGDSKTSAFQLQLGIVALDKGDYDAALSWYRKSLAISEELGNRAGMATSYHHLGIVAQAKGDYDAALSWCRKSLAIKEELGNRAGMANSYHQLGNVAEAKGDYDGPLSWYRKSLAISEELGKRVGMASSYHQLGMVAELKGDYDGALSWYRKSLAIEEELGNRAGMATSYHHLGIVAELKNDYDGALSWYRKSLAINEELGNRAGMAGSYHQLGIVAQCKGDYEGALSWYRRSLAISEELGNRAGMALTTSQLGVLSAKSGDLPSAVPFHLRALVMRLELGVPEVGIDLFHLSSLRQQMGADDFRRVVEEHVEPGDAETILGWLDQFDSGNDYAGSAPD